MPIISHVSYNDTSDLEAIITQNDGTPLYGEIEMFRRIFTDCSNSSFTWHFWHNLRLPVSIKAQNEIQIDFLLVSEKGVVVIEVKGGKVGIEQGLYYYEVSRERTYMERTPFDQARDYMYALISNRVISASQLFIDTVCAFPHTKMEHTSSNPSTDLGYKLWSKNQHENSSISFVDFCIEVLEKDKSKNGWRRPDLNAQEVEIAIQSLLFNFEDRSRNVYSERSMESILQRLNIDNLSTFNSLQKNERLFIEGGPGTGKTTIARAYIEKYHTLRGLYICWNKLLEAKIKSELWQAELPNCNVVQFASYIFSLQNQLNPSVSLEDITCGSVNEKLEALFAAIRERPDFIPYDYVIIDEAQDILDKGAIQLLDALTSVTNDGISTGRYLIFFDTEQGFNNESRQIDELADALALNGARFELDTNKRVPTNKEIVSFAKMLLDGVSATDLFQSIIKENYSSTQVFFFDGAKQLIKHINQVKKEIREGSKNWNDYILLADSSTKKELTTGNEKLYDRIATMEGIKELTPKNICQDTSEIPFTSMLAYKGLECKHVLLVINGRTEISTFELYIGMTRAIIDLQLLVLQ
ncbi:MAG: NERD domain-containing protein [Paludibacteraceae bacterium]|nr:NERD domain-containing protein [Paludibacteraceae bacterium]